MIVQQQPNNWSCLPTAFAIVCDLPVSELIKRIGHDGSKGCYSGTISQTGFHIQEIIDALLKDFSITELIDARFEDREVFQVNGYSLVQRIFLAMAHFSGVLWVTFGEAYGHALAWDHNISIFYDPKNMSVIPFEIFHHEKSSRNIVIEAFWIVEPRLGRLL